MKDIGVSIDHEKLYLLIANINGSTVNEIVSDRQKKVVTFPKVEQPVLEEKVVKKQEKKESYYKIKIRPGNGFNRDDYLKIYLKFNKYPNKLQI